MPKPNTFDCKYSNIDIYPSTLFFVENIGHKYDFEGGGVVGDRSGVGVVQIQRNKCFPQNKWIQTYSKFLE